MVNNIIDSHFPIFLKLIRKYSEKIRPYLILAGEYDLLEKYDIEKHMLKSELMELVLKIQTH